MPAEWYSLRLRRKSARGIDLAVGILGAMLLFILIGTIAPHEDLAPLDLTAALPLGYPFLTWLRAVPSLGNWLFGLGWPAGSRLPLCRPLDSLARVTGFNAGPAFRGGDPELLCRSPAPWLSRALAGLSVVGLPLLLIFTLLPVMYSRQPAFQAARRQVLALRDPRGQALTEVDSLPLSYIRRGGRVETVLGGRLAGVRVQVAVTVDRRGEEWLAVSSEFRSGAVQRVYSSRPSQTLTARTFSRRDEKFFLLLPVCALSGLVSSMTLLTLRLVRHTAHDREIKRLRRTIAIFSTASAGAFVALFIYLFR